MGCGGEMGGDGARSALAGAMAEDGGGGGWRGVARAETKLGSAYVTLRRSCCGHDLSAVMLPHFVPTPPLSSFLNAQACLAEARPYCFLELLLVRRNELPLTASRGGGIVVSYEAMDI